MLTDSNWCVFVYGVREGLSHRCWQYINRKGERVGKGTESFMQYQSVCLPFFACKRRHEKIMTRNQAQTASETWHSLENTLKHTYVATTCVERECIKWSIWLHIAYSLFIQFYWHSQLHCSFDARKSRYECVSVWVYVFQMQTLVIKARENQVQMSKYNGHFLKSDLNALHSFYYNNNHKMLKQRRNEGDKCDVERRRKSNNKKMCMCEEEEGGTHKQRDKWAYTHTCRKKEVQWKMLEKVDFVGKCDEMKTAIFPIQLVLLLFGRVWFWCDAFLCNIQTKYNEECMLSQSIEFNRFTECNPNFYSFHFSPRFKMRQDVVILQTIKSLILKMHAATSYLLWFHLLPHLTRILFACIPYRIKNLLKRKTE